MSVMVESPLIVAAYSSPYETAMNILTNFEGLLDSNTFHAISEQFTVHLDPTKARKKIIASMNEDKNQEFLEKELRFWRSPLGIRLTETMEHLENMCEAEIQILLAQSSIPFSSLDSAAQERFLVIESSQNIGESDLFWIGLYKQIHIATYHIANSFLDHPFRFTEHEFQEQLLNIERLYDFLIEMFGPMQYLYLLRNYSDEEFRYIFMHDNSEHSIWWSTTLRIAMESFVEEAIDSLYQELDVEITM
ncbi:hypothetical protein CHISP_1496 [Chitinispirillum alkaliphilum]|nr:hypothetical protein CHISP_1496 [Chitinispirillum alkaliphilum]